MAKDIVIIIETEKAKYQSGCYRMVEDYQVNSYLDIKSLVEHEIKKEA